MDALATARAGGVTRTSKQEQFFREERQEREEKQKFHVLLFRGFRVLCGQKILTLRLAFWRES
ncbi:MAG: hypothetical protein BGP23_07285 [Lysobacterales bacterium 66-474]|nr:MAG: hypothetical protein BGP23_07285 [Xanthomonadales bacterium 66-474]